MWYLVSGAGAAVFLGFARLLKRFYSFLGLGVVVNPWTAFFLTLVAVCAAISHLTLWQTMQGFKTIQGFEKLSGLVVAGPGQLILSLAASLLGNGSSVLGRLAGKPQQGVDPSSQMKDLTQLKSENVLIKFISQRILGRMNRELDAMAKRYDWDLIKPTVSRLLQNQRALDPSKEADEAEKFVLAFEPSPDPKTDLENKYSALQRVVAVSSFIEMRSRLAQGATEAP